MGFFRNAFEAVSELRTILKEGREEITEIMTDGFKEMVIKGNEDYKTSFEKKDEAKSIINNAERRLEEKLVEVESYAKEVEKQIQDFYNYKLDVTKAVLSSTKSTLEKIHFNVLVSNLDAPSISMVKGLSTTMIPTALSFAGTSLARGALISISPLASGALISMINQSRRVSAANDLLEEAKDFRHQVGYEIARLDSLKSKMYYISQAVKEETNLLKKLFSKLDQIIEEIENFQSKMSLSLSQTELERVKGLLDIANVLYQSIQTTFISNDLEISSHYTKEINKLKMMIG